jgi:plasmid maintenance system antidote protein VapI
MTQLEFALHFAVVNYGNNYALGKLAGVSADVLSRFSRKERNIRLDTAGRLAKVLGLTLTGEA